MSKAEYECAHASTDVGAIYNASDYFFVKCRQFSQSVNPHRAVFVITAPRNSRIKPYNALSLSLPKSSERIIRMSELLTPIQAARVAGINYPTIKQWILAGLICSG